jgi:hypothetical protein
LQPYKVNVYISNVYISFVYDKFFASKSKTKYIRGIIVVLK